MESDRRRDKGIRAVKFAVTFSAMQDALNIVASFGVRNFIYVVKVFVPMILFHPSTNVAAPCVVSGESQNVVAVEFVFQFGEVPGAITDIGIGFAQIFKVESDLIRFFAELMSNPGGGFGHDLHKPDRAALRVSRFLEITFDLHDGDGEELIDVPTHGIIFYGRAVREWIKEFFLNGGQTYKQVCG